MWKLKNSRKTIIIKNQLNKINFKAKQRKIFKIQEKKTEKLVKQKQFLKCDFNRCGFIIRLKPPTWTKKKVVYFYWTFPFIGKVVIFVMASVDADNENDTESAPWKVFEITKLVFAQREESK